MKMSDKGIEWLKGLEGSVKVNGKHVIYDDATGKPVPAGVPLPVGATIGYGHLVKPGEDFSAMTHWCRWYLILGPGLLHHKIEIVGYTNQRLENI